MQVMENSNIRIRLGFIAFILILCECTFLPADDIEKEKKVKSKATPHPPWVSHESFFSEKDGTIRFLGTKAQFSEIQWNQWKNNIPNLPFYSKVKSIFVNNCDISKNEIEYLSGFKNAESLTLGYSIEGVVISPESMVALTKLKKLTYVHISIHGLSDKHVAVLPMIPSLKCLIIEFPSSIGLSAQEHENWRPAKVTEIAAFEISKIKSLSILMIFNGPMPNDGDVMFTKRAFDELIRLPNLEELYISRNRTFKSGEYEKIEMHNVPDFVVFDKE